MIQLSALTTPLLLASCIVLLAGCANRDESKAPATPGTPATVSSEQQAVDGDIRRLSELAQRGDLDSQFKLGSFYFVGKPRRTSSRPNTGGNRRPIAAMLRQPSAWPTSTPAVTTRNSATRLPCSST